MVTIQEARTQLSKSRSSLAGARQAVQSRRPSFSRSQLRAPRISRQISGQQLEQAKAQEMSILQGQEQQLSNYESQIDLAQQQQDTANTQNEQYNYALKVFLGQTSGGNMSSVPKEIQDAARQQAESAERSYSRAMNYEAGNLPDDFISLSQQMDLGRQFGTITQQQQPETIDGVYSDDYGMYSIAPSVADIKIKINTNYIFQQIV